MIEHAEGEQAFCNGRKLTDNPYNPRTSAFDNWRTGWFYARWAYDDKE